MCLRRMHRSQRGAALVAKPDPRPSPKPEQVRQWSLRQGACLQVVKAGTAVLSIALLPYHPPLSMVLWSVGTVLHLGFTLYVLSAWLHQTHFEISHINPAWFIPIVGNILCTTWPFS